jgi:hypothetical protein
MTDLAMAVGATKLLISILLTCQHLADAPRMTAHTIVLNNPGTHRTDHNGLMKILKREGFGVSKPILALDQVFTDGMVRKMTVVTGGMGMMARLLPAIIVFAHNMAIHASLRVIAQIGEPLPFIKGKRPCPEKDPEEG